MTFPKNLHGDAQRTELEMEIWKIWEAGPVCASHISYAQALDFLWSTSRC